jgi:hypothetical protein
MSFQGPLYTVVYKPNYFLESSSNLKELDFELFLKSNHLMHGETLLTINRHLKNEGQKSKTGPACTSR